jgi:3-hydroxyacyl-CoA dehydrogenase/3a,7a,12a-trihydroxy-5b-cholest-24-enoyl-CoA hydratase
MEVNCMEEQYRFEGRVAVVTGAGHGLGRSYALLLAKRGAFVVVNDLGGDVFGVGADKAAAVAVVEEIQASGGEAVASTDSVEEGGKIVQCALDNFDRIDIVVNNAGIVRDRSFHKMSDDEWNAVINVHLNGAYQVTRAAWPHMREQQYGRVVMTSSVAGIYGNFGQANYSAAKLGVHGLTQTLAAEGRRHGIHVNTVAPIAGTRMFKTISSKEICEALDPVRVSVIVAWLCHEECPDSGRLYEAGAGWVAPVRWQRAETFAQAGRDVTTLEQVAANWTDINDFSESSTPNSAQNSLDLVGSRIGHKVAIEPQGHLRK